MAAKKRAKKVTYGEFLAWLEGVESMQPVDWTPNHDQWKVIREKLSTVKPDVEIRETVVEAEPKQAVGQPVARFVDPPSAADPHPVPATPPPRMQLSAHQMKPSEHEGVPASVNGPFVDAEGNLLSENEFL